MIRQFRSATRLERFTLLVGAVVLGAFVADRADARETRSAPRLAHAPVVVATAPESIVVRNVPDSLLGRSGKLLFRYLRAERPLALTYLSRLFGDSASRKPGVYRVAEAAIGGKPFSFITLVPFQAKRAGSLGSYRIGFWPGERRRAVSDAYANPEGFITVTPDNQDTQVSEHFRLRDFLTKDQHQTWPKYLVLREELIDKLELVIAELERSGVEVRHMSVMSGFRTPQYNARGGESSGRSSVSRHMYGDAADVFVDNDRNGKMDDLNRDGRIDTRDVEVIMQAVERVEDAHPDLVGGAGRYRATRAHGPFAHIDVRGNRARWGRA